MNGTDILMRGADCDRTKRLVACWVTRQNAANPTYIVAVHSLCQSDFDAEDYAELIPVAWAARIVPGIRFNRGSGSSWDV